MKKAFALVLVSGVILTGCSFWNAGSSPVSPSAPTVVGNWKLLSMSLPKQEAIVANENTDVQNAFRAQIQEVASKASAEFRADGTFTIIITDLSTSGTYTISEDGKVMTTVIAEEDGTTKNEELTIENLTLDELKLRSAVQGEDGQTEEMILTFGRKAEEAGSGQ